MTNNLIYIAKITKPHGIRGQAKLMSYAAKPEDIFIYPCLYDENLNEYKIKMHAQTNNMFIIAFNKNTSRNLVEELAGTKLYITKDMLLPKAEDEYYNNDLVDLEIIDLEQKLHGHVVEIHNFGADDVIEMKILAQKETIFLPFNKEYLHEINLEKNYLIFDFIGAGVDYKVKS